MNVLWFFRNSEILCQFIWWAKTPILNLHVFQIGVWVWAEASHLRAAAINPKSDLFYKRITALKQI
jgi:hypothetical protein